MTLSSLQCGHTMPRTTKPTPLTLRFAGVLQCRTVTSLMILAELVVMATSMVVVTGPSANLTVTWTSPTVEPNQAHRNTNGPVIGGGMPLGNGETTVRNTIICCAPIATRCSEHLLVTPCSTNKERRSRKDLRVVSRVALLILLLHIQRRTTGCACFGVSRVLCSVRLWVVMLPNFPESEITIAM
jgi:hypothetical protein